MGSVWLASLRVPLGKLNLTFATATTTPSLPFQAPRRKRISASEVAALVDEAARGKATGERDSKRRKGSTGALGRVLSSGSEADTEEPRPPGVSQRARVADKLMDTEVEEQRALGKKQAHERERQRAGWQRRRDERLSSVTDTADEFAADQAAQAEKGEKDRAEKAAKDRADKVEAEMRVSLRSFLEKQGDDDGSTAAPAVCSTLTSEEVAELRNIFPLDSEKAITQFMANPRLVRNLTPYCKTYGPIKWAKGLAPNRMLSHLVDSQKYTRFRLWQTSTAGRPAFNSSFSTWYMDFLVRHIEPNHRWFTYDVVLERLCKYVSRQAEEKSTPLKRGRKDDEEDDD